MKWEENQFSRPYHWGRERQQLPEDQRGGLLEQDELGKGPVELVGMEIVERPSQGFISHGDGQKVDWRAPDGTCKCDPLHNCFMWRKAIHTAITGIES